MRLARSISCCHRRRHSVRLSRHPAHPALLIDRPIDGSTPISAIQMERLNALLAAAHDPVHAQRAQAEAELQQLQRAPEALPWALSALQAPPTPGDAAARFYACGVAEAAVARRWARLPADQQAAVRGALWQAAVDPAAPHFQRSKLAAVLAHAAALDAGDAWPQFLSNLSVCLADEARREAGVDLLATAVEHLHSLAQATSVGLRGKVSWAAAESAWPGG